MSQSQRFGFKQKKDILFLKWKGEEKHLFVYLQIVRVAERRIERVQFSNQQGLAICRLQDRRSWEDFAERHDFSWNSHKREESANPGRGRDPGLSYVPSGFYWCIFFLFVCVCEWQPESVTQEDEFKGWFRIRVSTG